jgi:Na+-transporting NADH:ubiquinone oxidoreductase subunit NqrC
MKNIHVYNVMTEDGEKLQDLIIPMEGEFTWMDIFNKVQGAYLDNVDSYSYTEV